MMCPMRVALAVVLAVTCAASAQEWRVTEERLEGLTRDSETVVGSDSVLLTLGGEWALYPPGIWVVGTYWPYGLEPAPERLHFAAVVTDDDGRERVWRDGEVEAAAWSDVFDLHFSPDGNRLAYVARTDHLSHLCVDGTAGPGYTGIRTESAFQGRFEPPSSTFCPNTPFSPDGQHVAYAARTGQGETATWRIVLDGVPGPQLDLIDWESAIFSPDGRRFAYVAVTLDEGVARPEGDDLLFWGVGEWKQRVIIDGEPGPEYAMVSDLQFSPDGRRFAYTACSQRGEWFVQRVVLDGVPGPEFDDVLYGFSCFSPDSARFAYVVSVGQGVEARYMPVVDRVVGPPSEEAFPVVFSPDGRRVAHCSQEDGKRCVIVDGEASPWREPAHPFLDWPIVFSSGSGHVAWVASIGPEEDPKSQVVIDGQPGPPFDGVENLVFSGDGEHVAYVGLLGTGEARRWTVVIDGQEGAELDHGAYRFTFSPDGDHHAWVETIGPEGEERWCVTHDGQPGPWHDPLAFPVFSPDGQHLAYAAADGDIMTVIVDGLPGPEMFWPGEPYSGSPPLLGPTFSADSRHVAYGARIGDKWHVVLDGHPGRGFDEIFPHGPRFLLDGSLQYLARDGDVIYRVTLSEEP